MNYENETEVINDSTSNNFPIQKEILTNSFNNNKGLKRHLNLNIKTVYSKFNKKMSKNNYEITNSNFNSLIKTKQIDFGSLTEMNHNNDSPNIQNSSTRKNLDTEKFDIRARKNKSNSVLNQGESGSIKTNLLKSRSHYNFLSSKKPPSLDTIKNREKRDLIRNRKLSIENEINLPKISYKIHNDKVPDIWKCDLKIKQQVKNNYINTFLMNSNLPDNNKNIFKRSDEEVSNSYNDTSSDLSNDSGENLDKIKIEVINELNASATDFLEKHKSIFYEEKKHLNFQKSSKIVNKNSQVSDFRVNREIQKIYKELGTVRQSMFGHKYDFLNALHRKVEKNYFKKIGEYKTIKNVYSKYKQKKILDNKDYIVSSKLYVMNQNPLFQINNMISFPHMVKDSTILADLYDVNMYKLESVANKYKNV